MIIHSCPPGLWKLTHLARGDRQSIVEMAGWHSRHPYGPRAGAAGLGNQRSRAGPSGRAWAPGAMEEPGLHPEGVVQALLKPTSPNGPGGDPTVPVEAEGSGLHPLLPTVTRLSEAWLGVGGSSCLHQLQENGIATITRTRRKEPAFSRHTGSKSIPRRVMTLFQVTGSEPRGQEH